MEHHLNQDIFRRINEGDWKEVCKELDNRIVLIEKQLRKCEPEKLIGLQMKIEAMEELKLLPEQVLDREEVI